LEAGFVKPVDPEAVRSLLLEVQRARALGAQTQELRQRRRESEEARDKRWPDAP
jgi:hypothetical protein